ncbi:class I lanthipeptide [Kordia sp.]|uniref:class I lanthipeptide n=1 Tax=Kordia sp. TaxID=1965332 RepID=UPI0025B8F2A2|nr:class I lanthipeptide [Kordia sp.]MCH2193426.1 class I lanthipeptide [Kordia sp.]
MKKNKKSLKKLTLNKNVVSNLEKSQVNGGTIVTLACPVTLFCPTRFCPTRFNCPTLNIIQCGTIRTIDGPGCQSLVDGCQSALGCTF